MSSLYDLELQESNNFIHTLIYHGETKQLRQLREELHQARTKGDTQTCSDYESHNTEIGKKLKRYTELESDLRQAMQQSGMTSELAQKAFEILHQHPKSLKHLKLEDQKVIQEYWIKKKACIQLLTDHHNYLYDEIYAVE